MDEFTLQEMTELNQEIVDQAVSACICVNTECEILYYNPKAAEYFGVNRELEAFASFMIFSPFRQPNGNLSMEAATERLRKALRGEPQEFFWLHQDMDSKPLPSHVKLQKTRYMGRDCLLAVIEEDANAVVALTEMRASSGHMQAVLDAAPLSITLWNESLEIIDCNMETLNLFGISNKQEYIDSFMNFSPEYQPDGQRSIDTFFNNMNSAMERGRVTLEWMHQTKEGKPLPSEVTIAWTKVDNTMVMTTYVKDLTEQKAYVKELREADERTQFMLDAMPLACDFWDENLTMVDCNEEAIHLFGVDSKEEYCARFFELSPKFQPSGRPSSEVAMEKVEEALSTGVSDFEWMHQRLNGEPIPAEVRLARIKRNDKFSIVGYIRDVSQIKATLKELMDAKEAAEAANEAKSRFLSNMSHEIRTPMNAIIGMADLLMVEKLTLQQRKFVEDIKTSSSALLEIINDILDFSKIEAGKLELLPISFNLLQLLHNLDSMFTLVARQKGISFTMDIQEGCPECLYGDDIRMRQILINTIGNAVKFTQTGGVQLTVTYDKEKIHFAVIDTGIGIKEEDLPRLFDDFQQLDSSNTRRTGGSGLGLSITRNLIRLMSGELRVESAYGKGTTFFIGIPYTLGDESDVEELMLPNRFITAPDARILVVDDNEMNLNVASGLLRLFDIHCEKASSGQEAIELIERKKYDIVFMDHMMPEMDGMQATRILRDKGYDEEHLVVIALTANAISGVREMLLAAGLNDYLSKPIDQMLLNQILIKWLPGEKVKERGGLPSFDKPEHVDVNLMLQIRRIVDEMDVELALTRVGGMFDVLEQSLRILTRRLPETWQKLGTHVEKDMHLFAVEVHGVKGSLNNIGITAVALLAEELEGKAKAGDAAFCKLKLPELVNRLKALHIKLSAIIEAEETVNETKALGDDSVLMEGLQEIRGLLDAFEGDEAAERIGGIREKTYGENADRQLSELERLVEEFDYETAISLIDGWRSGVCT